MLLSAHVSRRHHLNLFVSSRPRNAFVILWYRCPNRGRLHCKIGREAQAVVCWKKTFRRLDIPPSLFEANLSRPLGVASILFKNTPPRCFLNCTHSQPVKNIPPGYLRSVTYISLKTTDTRTHERTRCAIFVACFSQQTNLKFCSRCCLVSLQRLRRRCQSFRFTSQNFR